MSRPANLTFEFVNAIPSELEDRTLYVSMDYATVAHKCCCGCGGEVVTPLSPTDWKLIYDGESISLSPSIGNWSFPCMSHYWIEKNMVRWARQWSKDEIETGRADDRITKERHHAGPKRYPGSVEGVAVGKEMRKIRRKDFWSWLSNLWSR